MIALRKRQENTLAVFLALGISFLLWFGVENASFLTADVAGPVVEFDEATDVVSYVADGKVHVVAGKTISAINSLSMLLSYDPETVKLSFDAIASPLQSSFAVGDPGYATIVVERIEAIAKGDTLVTIQVGDHASDVVISDVVVSFEDGTQESLAVSTM